MVPVFLRFLENKPATRLDKQVVTSYVLLLLLLFFWILVSSPFFSILLFFFCFPHFLSFFLLFSSFLLYRIPCDKFTSSFIPSLHHYVLHAFLQHPQGTRLVLLDVRFQPYFVSIDELGMFTCLHMPYIENVPYITCIP